METFEAVIARWPSLDEFAADLSLRQNTVAVWKHRGAIPATSFSAVVRAAAKRGYLDITHELLSDLAERRARRASPSDTAPGAAA